MSEKRLRGFSGEVGRYYSRFRRRYPPGVVDALAGAFSLTPSDVVVDLGCGTGQLTLPLAARVGSVVGVDPEPDMLTLAETTAADEGVENVSWALGFDSDLPVIADRIGGRPLGAITVATAIHWMNHEELFATARALVRPRGGIAVVTNGEPLWLHDTDWSRTIRSVLEEWIGHAMSSSCGTDERSQQVYAQAMDRAGFQVQHAAVDYKADLDIDALIGGLFSAMPLADVSDAVRRDQFDREVRRALEGETHFTENVSVRIEIGIRQ